MFANAMQSHCKRALASTAATIALAATAVSTAAADSTPVGPLPAKTPVTSVDTTKGSLFSLAVPSQLAPTGLVWRVARPLNATIVSQVGEGEIAGTTVLVFRVVGKGRASVVLALTKGDSSPKAISAVRYTLTVR